MRGPITPPPWDDHGKKETSRIPPVLLRAEQPVNSSRRTGMLQARQKNVCYWAFRHLLCAGTDLPKFFHRFSLDRHLRRASLSCVTDENLPALDVDVLVIIKGFQLAVNNLIELL